MEKWHKDRQRPELRKEKACDGDTAHGAVMCQNHGGCRSYQGCVTKNPELSGLKQQSLIMFTDPAGLESAGVEGLGSHLERLEWLG